MQNNSSSARGERARRDVREDKDAPLTRVSERVITRILGKTMRDAVRNKQKVGKAPYAYPRS